MSKTAGFARALELLVRLNEGQRVCTERLAAEFDVSERTVRRDLALIREHFGDRIVKEGTCYTAVKKLVLRETLEASELMLLASVVTLFGNVGKDEWVDETLKVLIKRSDEVYRFNNRPFETLPRRDVLRILEHAVRYRKVVELSYRTERHLSHVTFEPYRIVFLHENFYLAGVNVTKSKSVEIRRVSMIEEASYSGKIFFRDANILRFIDRLQSPWFTYGKEETEVRLRVDVSIRRFFLKKRYLASQQVVRTFENGDIEVCYKVTNLREVEDIVLRWLPKIEILTPTRLKRMIKRELKKKLEALD